MFRRVYLRGRVPFATFRTSGVDPCDEFGVTPIYQFQMQMRPWKAGKRAPPIGRKRYQICKMIWKEYKCFKTIAAVGIAIFTRTSEKILEVSRISSCRKNDEKSEPMTSADIPVCTPPFAGGTLTVPGPREVATTNNLQRARRPTEATRFKCKIMWKGDKKVSKLSLYVGDVFVVAMVTKTFESKV